MKNLLFPLFFSFLAYSAKQTPLALDQMLEESSNAKLLRRIKGSPEIKNHLSNMLQLESSATVPTEIQNIRDNEQLHIAITTQPSANVLIQKNPDLEEENRVSWCCRRAWSPPQIYCTSIVSCIVGIILGFMPLSVHLGLGVCEAELVSNIKNL